MNARFTRLLEGYTTGLLSADELKEFLELLPAHEHMLSDRIMHDLEQNHMHPAMHEERKKAVYAAILGKAVPRQISSFHLRRMWLPAAAAVLVLVVGIAGYIRWFSKTPSEAHAGQVAAVKKIDIKPGHEGAILMLANGQQVILDSAANGIIAKEGNSQVSKKNGQLVYEAAAGNAALVYHTIFTPRGRQFSLLLEDGTRVWLNAESSIRFPAAFSGSERRVEIKGEAYFEVAASRSKKTGGRIPFLVEASGMLVEVLGTRFNVNAYGDDRSIKTTLLEGKVKLSHPFVSSDRHNSSRGTETLILKPGEQAQLKGDGMELVPGIDPEQVIAWKNGLFHFDNEELSAILKQLQRWYDFDLAYETPVDRHYSGVMKRQQDIGQVLSKIEIAGGVRFRIQDKKVLVREEKN
jgi:transmembrane sensor